MRWHSQGRERRIGFEGEKLWGPIPKRAKRVSLTIRGVEHRHLGARALCCVERETATLLALRGSSQSVSAAFEKVLIDQHGKDLYPVVGAAGFELATPCTP